MKQSLVQTLEQGGNTYGQVNDPDDQLKGPQFVHERVSALTHDFVNNSNQPEIKGFAYELGTGNAFNIDIQAPGRVYTQNGVSYDMADDVTLTFDPADPDNPRIDLVVAVITDEVNAEIDLIPFVRLRTVDEFAAEVGPYPPQNISAATELHWTAVVQIKTGTAAASPASPVLAANEIPLYLVAINPAATQVQDSDVLDLRDVVRTIRQLNELAEQGLIDINSLTDRLAILEDITNAPINLPHIFGAIRSLGNILSDLQRQIRASADLPDIRYERPKVALTDPASSKIIATGGVDDDTPVVDIEVGGRVNFGDAEVAILPNGFADAALEARFETPTPIIGNVRRDVNISLGSITQGASDGSVDFVERAANLTTIRSSAASAARNSQFIEVFGGRASDGSSALGDWTTYDTINDTLTPRVPSITLPSASKPAMFSCGDGFNVLVVCSDDLVPSPRWFKVNCSTMAVTEITTTKPTGIQFHGDLIAPGKICIVAIGATIYWEFDTTTNIFTALGVSGSLPSGLPNSTGGNIACYYGQNKLLLLNRVSGSGGGTFVFDRTTLQWTKLNIPGAEDGSGGSVGAGAVAYSLANVNGRPLMIGGSLRSNPITTPEQAALWELRPAPATGGLPSWIRANASYSRIHSLAFASLLGTDNLSRGQGFFFGGQIPFGSAQNNIYASVQAGLIGVTYAGMSGVSIAGSSTFAQFEIAPFTADWEVAAYRASLGGNFIEDNIRVEVSLDDGDTWTVIQLAQTLAILNSDNPGVRRLRITLYKNVASPPILTLLSESLDQDGSELEDRLVVRYNAPETEQGLYIDRFGIVTLSATITPSTPDKALIHKVTPDGSNAPGLTNYINRRRPHVKYTGIKSADAASTKFQNELAVPVRYVDARAKSDADGSLYDIPEPTVTFDAEITVTGVTANDDVWLVEIEG